MERNLDRMAARYNRKKKKRRCNVATDLCNHEHALTRTSRDVVRTISFDLAASNLHAFPLLQALTSSCAAMSIRRMFTIFNLLSTQQAKHDGPGGTSGFRTLQVYARPGSATPNE